MGAQAFSSFDTLLAPFVKKDKLTYKEVKQCIQSFVYGVNTPSRWGCVPETYKVMTTDGWKGIDELKAGDVLYTWVHGKLHLCPNNATVIKDYDGELICFENPHYKYKQEVTDYHRVLVSKTNKQLNEAVVMHAGEIYDDPYNMYYTLPAGFTDVNVHEGLDLSDDEIRLAAMIYTDGSLSYYGENSNKAKVQYFKSFRRDKQIHAQEVFDRLGLVSEPKIHYTAISPEGVQCWSFYGDQARHIIELVGQKTFIHERFFKMNQRQAKLFLDTWTMHDGDEEKMKAQCDNPIIVEQLLFINVLAGNIASYKGKMLNSGHTVNYVKTTQVDKVKFTTTKRRYKGRVWCPSSNDGTAIFMNDRGGVFISANCQSPFSNITIDWTVHPDLKNMPAIVGGKEQDFTYGDCTEEQRMINKAFIEVMTEGDAKGQGFAYPINCCGNIR